MNGLASRWILLPGTRVVRDGTGGLCARSATGERLDLGPATPDLLAGLRALIRAERVGLIPALEPLHRHGWLGVEVSFAGRPLLIECPLGGTPVPVEAPPRRVRPGALSRFSVVRRDQSGFVMESPLARSVIRIGSATVLDILVNPEADPARSSSMSSLPVDAREAILDRLAAAGFLTGPDEQEFRLRQWGPHELWFHARSRWGGAASADPVGPSSWARDLFPPLPSRHPVSALDQEAIALARPDNEDTFLDERRSIRQHDDEHPITAAQLGEFLHHCARVRREMTYEGVEYSSRPYPSGGTAYELELYPVVRLVNGLDPGIYRYLPHEHTLVPIKKNHECAPEILRQAAVTAMTPTPPQILILVAARFGRMLWRYAGMGYATILKNVGVLYQTMYLVATRMGLAGCALGNSDTRMFARATGLDPLVESSVGEFMLGAKR